jgi:hypothetical protein
MFSLRQASPLPDHPSLFLPEYSGYIRRHYITTDTGLVIQTVMTTSEWGVEFFPLEVTRYAPANLFTVNLTVGVPWHLTVVFDKVGYSNTQKWPCNASVYTPWTDGVRVCVCVFVCVCSAPPPPQPHSVSSPPASA